MSEFGWFLATIVVELTRFRGHIILWPQGVHDAENTSPVFP